MEKTASIYKIENTITNQKYVGSTKNFLRRKKEHIRQLRKGSHHSLWLQNSFNLHGEESFLFEILCVTTPEKRIEFEQAFIDTGEYVFNVRKKAGEGFLDKSGSAKERISTSLKNYYKQNPHPQKGRKRTEEELENVKIGLKHYYEDNPGVRKGKFLYEGIIQLDPSTLVELQCFKSAVDAQTALGLAKPASSKILRACKKPQKRSAYGFKWKFKNPLEYESSILPEKRKPTETQWLIEVIDINTNNIIQYESAGEAEKAGVINRSTISRYIKNNIQSFTFPKKNPKYKIRIMTHIRKAE